MKVGYARSSNIEPNIDKQINALKMAGCEKIIISNITDNKEESLQRLKRFLRNHEDTLVIWRLDRLGVPIKQIFGFMNALNEMGLEFHSLEDNLDTTNVGSTTFFDVCKAIINFQTNMRRESTKVGLSNARARGRNGGRPKGLSETSQKKAYKVLKLHEENKISTTDIMKVVDIGSRATLYRYINWAKENQA